MNIRDYDQVQSAVQEVVAKYGPLHGLVNNAGGQVTTS
jgi:NAD(P)-dependent dehydrogenase (short-subunit alcohol dehydrogenase family)